MHPILERIIRHCAPCVFFSPHLDDAVLSCGGLIAFLARRTDVRVVTIFTRCSTDRNTLSARAFLKQCGVDDANTLFEMRRREDRDAIALSGAQAVHLGYTDALWRRIPDAGRLRSLAGAVIPEFDHIYPTYRWHMRRAKPSPYDADTVENIRQAVRSMVDENPETAVFCPLALGRHIDHVVTNRVVFSVRPDSIAWADFPYNMKDNRRDIEWGEYERLFDWESGQDSKERMIRKYETQVRAMFPEAIPIIPENFYRRSSAKSGESGQEEECVIE
jgi:LmbE family N-acetylglucosaminyl deacetylase